jgi:uncharacterized DUF497 family protein
MKHIEWDELKNARLKSQRSICFEDVQAALEENDVLDDTPHPNQKRHKGQRILIVEIDSYAYFVPYVEDETKIFLKTIIPNRKATKKYLKEN